MYKTVVSLRQETPYIHFQHSEIGATLRATEVKPKLDSFLIKKLGGIENVDEKWIVKGESFQIALNYKLRFASVGETQISRAGDNLCKAIDGGITDERKRKEYSNASQKAIKGMYFANMVKDTNFKRPYVGSALYAKQKEIKKTYKETVFCSKTEMTIICFVPNLMKLICKYIQEFFAVENFGSRQSKGFGSYMVTAIGEEKVKLSEPQVATALCERYGAKKCYKFKVKTNKDPLEYIKVIYSIMKSGVNYSYTRPELYRRSLLFVYMKGSQFNGGSGFGNEKAYLKQQGLAPINVRDPKRKNQYHKNRNEEDVRYVRALLGVGDSMFGPRAREKVTLKEKSGNIQRYPSTIFFKVIGDTVYYVGERISDKILGTTFEFSSSCAGYQKRELCVPTKKDGVGEDFMDGFLEYCKSELNCTNPKEGDSLGQIFGVLFGDASIKIMEVGENG